MVSDQLYRALVGFAQAESESGSIVRNTPEGQGLEAWRKLAQRWHSSQARSRVTDKEAVAALPSLGRFKLIAASGSGTDTRRVRFPAKHGRPEEL